MMEDDHAIRSAHDRLHVMLDQDDRDAAYRGSV